MNDLRRIGKTIFFRKMESTASDNWLVSKRDLGGVKTAEEFATRVYRDRLYLLTAKDGLMSRCDLWDLQAKSYPQLELPARLLRAGVNYYTAGKNKTALLELPQEERRILEQALGLEE